jgi:large subunit ribosomal protein L9
MARSRQKLKVLLVRDVEGLGGRGTVVDVAPGFARNFLIPSGAALPVVKEVARHAEFLKVAAERQRRRALEHARELEEALSRTPVEIKVRVGAEGRLFGSVTAADLAEALAEKGIAVDRRRIELKEPIRAVGEYSVPVRLHPEVEAAVLVRVVPL